MTPMFIGASFGFCTRLYWVYDCSIRLLLAIFNSLFQLASALPSDDSGISKPTLTFVPPPIGYDDTVIVCEQTQVTYSQLHVSDRIRLVPNSFS